MVGTLAWPIAPVEDNGIGVFRTASGQLALLHSSWTQWDPVFAFEVFGERGSLQIVGRETLTLGRRGQTLGPAETQTWTLPTTPQQPFADDWREFASAIREGRLALTDGRAGLAAVELAYAVYEANRTGQTVRLAATRPA